VRGHFVAGKRREKDRKGREQERKEKDEKIGENTPEI